LIAFRQLVQSLIPVFERVTGERASVTWNDKEKTYQGPFLKLVQNLVLILRDRFPEITYPSSGLAVDISVYKLLQRDRDSGGKKRSKETAQLSAKTRSER
jgi:hypothetical protein